MPDALSTKDAAQRAMAALQQRAATQSRTLRAPPLEPTSCCGRGCNGCVWESYYGAVDWWCEEAALQLQA